MSSPESSDNPTGTHVPRPKVAYWRQNLVVITILLTIWAFVSIGCSIFWVEWLNQFHIGNLPLGFWMSQQGAMYVFLVLILVYAVVMDFLDRKHGVKE